MKFGNDVPVLYSKTVTEKHRVFCVDPASPGLWPWEMPRLAANARTIVVVMIVVVLLIINIIITITITISIINNNNNNNKQEMLRNKE